MALKTYDPKKYVIVFAGIPLNKGLAEGTFLTITPTTAGFSSKVGADGEVVRTRHHDRRATATLTVMQTSEINDRLSAIYEADRQATNGAGVGIFHVQDLAGTSVFRASKAWISDDPDVNLEPEAGPREWTFEMADYKANHGSNPDD